MQVTLESIQLDAGMQNASGTVAMAIGGNPVRIRFAGTISVIGDAPAAPTPLPVQLAAPPPIPPPKRTYKKRGAAAPAPAPTGEPAQTWIQSIMQALAGGNLTTAELFEHVNRLRGVTIKTPDEPHVQMMRFQSAMSDCKRKKLVLHIMENSLDKWKGNFNA